MPLLAQVAVENTVYHFDKLFSYEIPCPLANLITPGIRVLVPFGSGNRERVGMVFSLGEGAPPGIKQIREALDKEPVLSQEMLELALWMKERYYCTLYEAVKLMIPVGSHLHLKDSYLLNSDFKDFDREGYSPVAWQVILLLRKEGKAVSLEKLAEKLGITPDCPALQELLDKGIVCKVNMAASKIKDAVSKMVRPVPGYSGKLTPRQKDVYQTLLDAGEASEKELCYFTGASSSVIRALADKGAAEIFEYEVYRRPEFPAAADGEEQDLILSPQQQAVLEQLINEYDQTDGKRCSLLYGVTGSGKTSVFLKLIQYVREKGKDVIVMVPEISLTAQTISRFQKIFGDSVAVFHSGLSLGERMDEWKRVRRGEAGIVVGTRSAVFAPVNDLGLIVIDEEQEHTYKSESSPRYDAREAARYRCMQKNAFCLLSSATPSVESCWMAQRKQYGFHKLDTRFGAAILPEVQLVDMNGEAFPGDDSVIGPTLSQQLLENFERGKQSIILLNRRGYHTFVSCRTCGEVISCPNCSISLTYHSANQRLMCHYCGYSTPVTGKCPSCGSESLVFRGVGTQRAEEQLNRLMPDARVLRLDADSVAARYSLEKKLNEFSKGEYDVMIGTQMVAKGLNFENVTLVGVLSADQSLYSDDFRSNERTFDLLTQVVGRAGRGKYPGKAVIQTFAPENRVLYLAARQDYFEFYKQELTYRKALLYPPFVDILIIGFVGSSESQVREGAKCFLSMLTELAAGEYPELPLRVLSPSPAAVAKVSGKYRYKLLIKCRHTAKMRRMTAKLLVSFALQKEYQQVTAYADPNPYRIL